MIFKSKNRILKDNFYYRIKNNHISIPKSDFYILFYYLGNPLKRDSTTGSIIPTNDFDISLLQVSKEYLDDKMLLKKSRREDVIWISPFFNDQKIKLKGLQTFEKRSEDCSNFSNGASWGISEIGANKSDFCGSGVKIAIIDDGINISNSGLSYLNDVVDNEKKIAFKNFVEKLGDRSKLVGGMHGTQCASIICSRDVYFRKYSKLMRIGLARNIEKLIVSRVIPSFKYFDIIDLYEAILWSCREGADIISMSFGKSVAPLLLEELKNKQDQFKVDVINKIFWIFQETVRTIEFLINLVQYSKPTVFVSSAGNGSSRSFFGEYSRDAHLGYVRFPEIANNVLSVGAVTKYEGLLILDSKQNRGIDFVAPGDYTCTVSDNGSYKEFWDTSAAAPHVSGVIALWINAFESKNVEFNIQNLRKVLKETSKKTIQDGNNFFDTGFGFIQAPTDQNISVLNNL